MCIGHRKRGRRGNKTHTEINRSWFNNSVSWRFSFDFDFVSCFNTHSFGAECSSVRMCVCCAAKHKTLPSQRTFVTQLFNSLISSDCKHAMIHIKWFEILFRKVFHHWRWSCSHWHRRAELSSALHRTDLSDLFSTLSYIFAFRENCFEVASSFGFRIIFFYSFFSHQKDIICIIAWCCKRK